MREYSTSQRTASVGAAGQASTVPNSNIKGKPAHFSPTTLSASSRWDGVHADCKAQASFTMTNKKSVNESVKVTATGISGSLKATIKPNHSEFVCLGKAYTGTVTAKLTDGKKLTVHVS